MPATKVNTVARALAVVAGLGSTALAMAPLSNEVHSETAGPQEIGTMTSDGHLVYSVNYCTIVYTTSCDVSLSTGAPVPTATSSADAGVPSGSGSSDQVYPAPTNGGPGSEHPPAPSNAYPTSGDQGSSTHGGGQETGVTTETGTGELTATNTASQGMSTYSGGEGGTATATAETVTPTAGASVFKASLVGVAIGIVAVCLF